ncbi:hypothetical protein CsSME_00006764 [Camellia sinensis var. sinensis]
MDLETPIAATEEQLPAADSKRSREDSGEDSAGAKKLKVEKSPEEDRLDQLEGTEGDKESDRVSVGPKSFVSGDDSAGAKKLKVEKSAEEDRLDQLEGTEGDKESDRVSVGPKSFVSGDDSAGAKKLKVEKSAEEDRLDQLEGTEGDKESDRVSVGPKSFVSSVDMFDYFYKFLHYWAPNVNVNKFEQMVLLELLKKGHPEPEKKIGNGISAFQVRFHPQFKSRCFFIIRNDESVDDFSFRKCVDRILPLPENMLAKSDVNKALGGGGGGHGKRGGGGGGGGGGRGGGRGRGYGRGRGRGGKLKN